MRLRIFLICMLVFTLSACQKATFLPDDEEEAGEEQESSAQTLSEGEGKEITPPDFTNINVATVSIKSGEINFSVRIASTDEERAKGLMGVESMPKNNGMLFVYPEDTNDPFWTKDMIFPIDIIFISQDMKVCDMITNAAPDSEELLAPGKPYRYVLEVNGGISGDSGIAIGDDVELRIGPQ